MPRCKNDETRSYSGDEPSPKGRGYCAHAEEVGKRRKGKDGKFWVVRKTKKGKRWFKVSKSVKSPRGLYGSYSPVARKYGKPDYSFTGRRESFDNKTLKRAVKEYFQNAESRKRIEQTYGPIERWNTSRVTDMSYLFSHPNYKKFNANISGWDVSNVKIMAGMFAHAEYFNQPIGTWDVSNVDDMGSMFLGAKRFNQPIGHWNTSNVHNMFHMFSGATSFQEAIKNGRINIDTKNVTGPNGRKYVAWNVKNIVNEHKDIFDPPFFVLGGPNKKYPNWLKLPKKGTYFLNPLYKDELPKSQHHLFGK